MFNALECAVLDYISLDIISGHINPSFVQNWFSVANRIGITVCVDANIQCIQ